MFTKVDEKIENIKAKRLMKNTKKQLAKQATRLGSIAFIDDGMLYLYTKKDIIDVILKLQKGMIEYTMPCINDKGINIGNFITYGYPIAKYTI